MGLSRGCGKRKAGYAYAVTEVGDRGTPWWRFLKDPPVPIDAQAWGISAQGITLIPDSNGTFHLWDWIGESHYPNITDFIEEGLRFGFSGLLPKQFDYTRLTTPSLRKLIHPRACVTKPELLWPHRLYGQCKTRQEAHTNEGCYSEEWQCASFHWELVTGGTRIGGDDDPRRVERKTPSCTYYGWCPPEVEGLQWQLGYFLDLPITRIEVVRGDEGEEEDTLAHIDQYELPVPVELVDE